DERVADEGRFDLDRAEAVAADVDHVVDAAHDPVVAVVVLAGVVASEVVALELRPVLLFVAVVIAPDAAEHAGPGTADAEHAALVRFDGLASFVENRGDDAGERLGATAGLCWNRAGQRRHHDATGFGLPPCIDDRAALAANFAVIPHPGFGVDAFADGAE